MQFDIRLPMKMVTSGNEGEGEIILWDNHKVQTAEVSITRQGQTLTFSIDTDPFADDPKTDEGPGLLVNDDLPRLGRRYAWPRALKNHGAPTLPHTLRCKLRRKLQDTPTSVEELAAQLHISSSHLIRLCNGKAKYVHPAFITFAENLMD